MKYSRNQLNKSGDILIGQDPFKRQEAFDMVTDWRQSHLFVLQEIYDELTILLKNNGIPFAFSSHRIKRMQSIIEKLKNNEQRRMKLGGLHDIGGVRFVFDDLQTLKQADTLIQQFQPKNFLLEKRYDYVSSPKDSGYKSIHFVYKYISSDNTYDGLHVELQIRTKLQHCWAMAVETASLISNTSLKASLNDGSVWREFFRLVSAIFSKKEQSPVLKQYADLNDDQLCVLYYHYLVNLKLVDTLKALRVSVNYDKHSSDNGFCVLIINFKRRIVNFKYFSSEEEALASETFTNMERMITSEEAALMVSMRKLKELQMAYSSYFLDTELFIENLNSFESNCKYEYLKD